MDKIAVSVLGGLAIAASLWNVQGSPSLLDLSQQYQLQDQEIPNEAIFIQSDLSPEFKTMTTAQLETILATTVDNLDGQAGQWQFEHDGVSMVAITNEEHDRMRLVAPITSLSSLTSEQRDKMLFANFHTTLDARYAIGTLGGQPAVVSVFVHPLTSLTEDYFRSALDQVSRSAQTFGTTYSSGALLLNPGEAPNRPPNIGEEVGI